MVYSLDIKYFAKPKKSLFTKTNNTSVSSNVSNQIKFDKFDLIWASIYSNKQHKGIINPMKRLDYDIAVVDYLFDFKRFASNLDINRDILYLEQTQKTILINRLGVIICNVVAKKYFGLKHIYHLQNFNSMKVAKGVKCPDFISRKKKRYFILETKASTYGYQMIHEDKAIDQLNSIRTVNSVNPEKYFIYTVIRKNNLEVNVIDPQGGLHDIIMNDDEFEDYKLGISHNFELKKKIGNYDCYGYKLNNYFLGYADNYFCDGDYDISIDNEVVGRIFEDKTIICLLDKI